MGGRLVTTSDIPKAPPPFFMEGSSKSDVAALLLRGRENLIYFRGNIRQYFLFRGLIWATIQYWEGMMASSSNMKFVNPLHGAVVRRSCIIKCIEHLFDHNTNTSSSFLSSFTFLKYLILLAAWKLLRLKIRSDILNIGLGSPQKGSPVDKITLRGFSEVIFSFQTWS